MHAGALLHDRQGLADAPAGLEEAHHENRVGDVADVDRRHHVLPEHALLRNRQERGDAAARQIRGELVQAHDGGLRFRNRGQIAGEAVDQHDAHLVVFDGLSHGMAELSGRHRAGLDLGDLQTGRSSTYFDRFIPSASPRSRNVCRCSSNRNAAQGIPFRRGGREIVPPKRRLAHARRPEHQRAGAHRHAVVEQRIELLQARSSASPSGSARFCRRFSRRGKTRMPPVSILKS